MKTRGAFIIYVLPVLLIVAVGCRWVWQAKRQYALNRQLIDALLNHDNKQALALVNAGADPNTREDLTPAPSFKLLLNQLLHRSSTIANRSATAFQFACGGAEYDEDATVIGSYPPPEDVPLVHAMLLHGADIKATNAKYQCALHCAAVWEHPYTVQLLLTNGANVNAQAAYGVTPLMIAASKNDVETTRILLEHDADVGLADQTGATALHEATVYNTNSRIVRMLLAHGANPNVSDKHSDTPLMRAQKHQRPDLVTLMRKGAK